MHNFWLPYTNLGINILIPKLIPKIELNSDIKLSKNVNMYIASIQSIDVFLIEFPLTEALHVQYTL